MKWSLFRRYLTKLRVPHFDASILSYVNHSTSFEGYNHVYSQAVVRDSTIGLFTYLADDAKVVNSDVGRFCSIGPGALVGGLGVHPTDWVSTHPVFYSPFRQAGSTTFSTVSRLNELPRVAVGHDVWIGARAIVLDGVSIGHGAIIAAGAVVNRDVEAYAIVGGVPMRFIRSRVDAETKERLLALAWWNWSVDRLERASASFRCEPSMVIAALDSFIDEDQE